jgi:hypothetical protein
LPFFRNCIPCQELHNITIFSDSQSALGILTLNWKGDNYFQSINEIKSQINYLKEQGVVVSFNWTPGHASIKGTRQICKISFQLWRISSRRPIDFKIRMENNCTRSTGFSRIAGTRAVCKCDC